MKDLNMLDLIDIQQLQKMQDSFAEATGIASIITLPNGKPITKPSNFCDLCIKIIRKTKKGLENCYKSDAELGKPNKEGPIIKRCLSGGLWDAGVSIYAGNIHVANWLIGQVKNDQMDLEKMYSYISEIGADRAEFIEAFDKVPIMSHEKLKKVADSLFFFANLISDLVYKNILIEENEKRLQLTFEGTGDGVWDWNVINNKVIFSTNWKKMLGFEEWEIGDSLEEWGDRIHLDDRKQVYKYLNAHLEGKTEYYKKEYRMKCKDGSYKWILDRGKVFARNEEGKPLRVLGTHMDITQSKQMEKKLIRSEKLAVVGQLTAGIAHEFNNLLAIIGINSQLISLTDCDQYFKSCKEAIADINNALNRGKKIVSNMIAFSKPDFPQKKLCCAEEIIESVLKSKKIKIEMEHIEILKNYHSKNKIYVDCGQIEQVIMNLIINAIHAIKLKGKGRITINVFEENNFVTIEIEDTGIGMSDSILANIFNPFYSTKGAYAQNNLGIEGNGLGLSVSYSIINNHNGIIEVRSKENYGSKFSVKIPTTTDKNDVNNFQSNKESNENKQLKFKKLKILMIDDEKQFLDAIKKMLEKYNCIVDISATAVEGIDLAKKSDYDLIILDMLLPDMDGKEIFKKIRKFNECVPIIFISGQVELEIDVLKELGAFEILQKPFDIMELNRILNEIREADK
jgi:PAS domain S-box-containing protein